MTGHRAAFHPLRVAAIDELTDDALAVTFDVPPGLAEDYAFSHGQHLNIRGGDDVRRSYSICTPPSSRVLRIGVKRLPGGAFSEGVLDRLRVGDELEVMTPAGRFTTDARPGGPQDVRRDRGRVRDHPGAVHRGRDPGGGARVVGRAGLRQPHPPHRDVPRRGARPQGPVPRAAADRPRPLPGEPGRRAVLGPPGRAAAAPDPRRAAARPRGRRLVPVRAPADGRGAARGHRRRRRRDRTDPQRAVPRRPRPAAAGRHAGRGSGGSRARHDPARRPRLRPRAATGRRTRPGGGPPGPFGPAVRLQGRGVRDLPGQGRRGQRRDGRQLRARAGRGGAGLRAHLPVAPHRCAGWSSTTTRRAGARYARGHGDPQPRCEWPEDLGHRVRQLAHPRLAGRGGRGARPASARPSTRASRPSTPPTSTRTPPPRACSAGR